jgi:hypothetical protein
MLKKIIMGNLLRVIAFSFCLVFLLPSSNYASQNQESVDTKIVLSVTLPNGTNFETTVSNDGALSVEKDGVAYTFSPKIDRKNGIGVVELVKGTKDFYGNVVPSHCETIQFSLGNQGTTQLDGGFIVEIISFSENYRKNVETQIESLPARCCVTCGGWTACGCKVESACGSCCVEECC